MYTRPWLAKEIETLRCEYPAHGATYVAALLGRSADAVMRAARREGLRRYALCRRESVKAANAQRREQALAWRRRAVEMHAGGHADWAIAARVGISLNEVQTELRRRKLAPNLGTASERDATLRLRRALLALMTLAATERQMRRKAV